MSEINNTTKKEKKQYHHLTMEKRAQIEILLNAKDKNGKRLFNNTYIANAVGVDKSTISRELKNRIKLIELNIFNYIKLIRKSILSISRSNCLFTNMDCFLIVNF